MCKNWQWFHRFSVCDHGWGGYSTQLGLRGTEEQHWKALAAFLLQLVTQISQLAQLLAVHMTHTALPWKPPLSSHAFLKTNRAIFYIFQNIPGRFASWVSRSVALEAFHNQDPERTSSTEKPMVNAATSGIRSPGMGQLPSRKTTDWGDRKILNSPPHTPEKQTSKAVRDPGMQGSCKTIFELLFLLPPSHAYQLMESQEWELIILMLWNTK